MLYQDNVAINGREPVREAIVPSNILDASGLATVLFSKGFDTQPAVALAAIAPGGTQPVILSVDSWIMSGGQFTGVVVKGYRTRPLPAVIALLSGLVNYDVAAGSAVGVAVSAVAFPIDA